MKVRIKQEAPTLAKAAQRVTLDKSALLVASFLPNRVHAVAALQPSVSVQDFWTFTPVVCNECHRPMPLNLLHIGPDLFIRCNDNDACITSRPYYKPPPESKLDPVKAPKKGAGPSKGKYRIKSG